MALPARKCQRESCGVVFEPPTARRVYHSETCRTADRAERRKARKAQGREIPVEGQAPPSDLMTEARAKAEAVELGYREITSALVTATREQLERADVAQSPVGLAVLALAYRLENGFAESGPALAALNREFRAALEAALAKDTRHRDQVGEARMIAQQARFRTAGSRAG